MESEFMYTSAAAVHPTRSKKSMSELLSSFKTFETTLNIPIPRAPLEQIIGQDEAVKIAFIAARQRRNLLLVGPPGTGKSLLAQAISFHLPKPTQEVNVLHNPESPERPMVEVRTHDQINAEKKLLRDIEGRVVPAQQVPGFVAERLGFSCRRCANFSPPRIHRCPYCGEEKFTHPDSYSPFGDLTGMPNAEERQDRVHTTRLDDAGREEVVVYQRDGESIRVLDQKSLEKIDAVKRKAPRKTIVPMARRNFVIATGANETELLGDVRHDPYGGHPNLGTLPYLRVIPGAVHEAHEGVLFIDEISALANIQRFLLTAMQERNYPIVGRNPHGSGASVKVEGVPCNFLLIAASNINDLANILAPLRSRILGNGYEVLLQTTMPDVIENRAQLSQFVAQEIRKDTQIPQFSRSAVIAIIDEAARRARIVDKVDGALTLRLRELSGIVRLAGDIAKIEEKQLVEKEDVALAVIRGKSAEEQLKEKYGSLYNASMGDSGNASVREGKEVS